MAFFDDRCHPCSPHDGVKLRDVSRPTDKSTQRTLNLTGGAVKCTATSDKLMRRADYTEHLGEPCNNYKTFSALLSTLCVVCWACSFVSSTGICRFRDMLMRWEGHGFIAPRHQSWVWKSKYIYSMECTILGFSIFLRRHVRIKNYIRRYRN